MEDVFDRIWKQKYVFFGTFFLVFTISYIVLVAIDFLPETPADETVTSDDIRNLDEVDGQLAANQDQSEEMADSQVVDDKSLQTTVADTTVTNEAILPVSLTIERLGRTITVLNPTSRNIADLDAALLEGAVRHPNSATLSQEGNVFILGHSSYLPQVFNKNFQAFNGIQDLEWGDTIKVSTADAEYIYRVEKVYRAKAQDVTVPIAGTGNMLTLATCNSFGSIDDRYIVEAKRIEVRRR